MTRLRPWMALLAGLSLASAGCMIPVYRNPAGFSSTYHRHVFGPEREIIRSQLPMPVPAKGDDGVFFPMSVQNRLKPAQQPPQISRTKTPPRLTVNPEPPVPPAASRR